MPAKFTFSNKVMRTWLLIHRADNLQKRAVKRIVAKAGLSVQMHSIILAISHLPAPVKVTDVAHWLDRNPNAISMRIDIMEKDGLMTRVRDQNDHRAVTLEVTPLGKARFDKANKLSCTLFQEFFDNLSREELTSLCSLMERVHTQAFGIVNPGKPGDEADDLDGEED